MTKLESSPEDRMQGLAIRISSAGTLEEVLRDDLGLSSRCHMGRHWEAMVDERSRDKARLMLTVLKGQRAVFDWELNVFLDGGLDTMHFGACQLDKGFLVIGARTRNGMTRFYDDLMRVNNEQINQIRSATKDLSLMQQQPAEPDHAMYDELSRLNNELVNAQRELSKKNAQLALLSEDKNRFLGMAAHDLRTPLGVILTYSQLLLEGGLGPVSADQEELITSIKQSSDFMLRLVNDLLDTSAIEAGRLVLQYEPADLDAILRKAVALNSLLAAAKKIEVTYVPEGPLPLVTMDPVRMEQVMNNLLSNATKFAASGSSVEVTAAIRGEEVVVGVRDHGQGIPEQEMQKLFKSFSRASVTSTGGERSTGLGLAIAKRIIVGHAGRIWLESSVGVGTTFFVALPLSASGHGGHV